MTFGWCCIRCPYTTLRPLTRCTYSGSLLTDCTHMLHIQGVPIRMTKQATLWFLVCLHFQQSCKEHTFITWTALIGAFCSPLFFFCFFLGGGGVVRKKKRKISTARLHLTHFAPTSPCVDRRKKCAWTFSFCVHWMVYDPKMSWGSPACPVQFGHFSPADGPISTCKGTYD